MSTISDIVDYCNTLRNEINRLNQVIQQKNLEIDTLNKEKKSKK